MPYGIPWETVHGYRCVSCRNEHSHDTYRPFCCLCGAKQPDEKDIETSGLIIPAELADKEVTRDIDRMNDFLNRHVGREIAIWFYSVSHSELELRLRHSGDPGSPKSIEPWRNTVIYCGATDRIILPKMRWECSLEIRSHSNRYGIKYILEDKQAEVVIECRMVTMYFDVEPIL